MKIRVSTATVYQRANVNKTICEPKQRRQHNAAEDSLQPHLDPAPCRAASGDLERVLPRRDACLDRPDTGLPGGINRLRADQDLQRGAAPRGENVPGCLDNFIMQTNNLYK